MESCDSEKNMARVKVLSGLTVPFSTNINWKNKLLLYMNSNIVSSIDFIDREEMEENTPSPKCYKSDTKSIMILILLLPLSQISPFFFKE